MDILITEDLGESDISRLAQRFQVVHERDLWRDKAQLGRALRQARAVLVRNQTQLSEELLADAPQLMAIGRFGVGLDNIDLATASKFGVVVIAPLEANALSVAELTMGFILALARKLTKADLSTKAGLWDRKGCTGIELHGRS